VASRDLYSCEIFIRKIEKETDEIEKAGKGSLHLMILCADKGRETHLDHIIVGTRCCTGRMKSDVISRHANDAFEAAPITRNGNIVSNEVANVDIAAMAVAHRN